MNWRVGLTRLSAVFWGFWALVAIVSTAFASWSDSDRLQMMGIGVLLALGCGVGHVVTRWILSGFFKG